MTTVKTQLGNTIESARRERVEPTGGITATNVQKALEGLDAGKTAAGSALLIARNLSDVASAATARANLGVLASAANLSDLASAATARANLGLGSMATQAAAGVAITGGSITGLGSPSNPSDAATKAYVDATAAGLSIRDSVAWATAAALAANTYSNGASGVGATLTGNAFGALAVDGSTPAVNDRVLVKNEASAASNGIYTVTVVGDGSHAYVLTRAADANQASNLFSGIFVFCAAGTVNTGAGFVLTTTGAITVGTTALSFTQFSGAGEITAGTGLSKSGNTLSLAGTIAAGGPTGSASVVPVVTYNAQGQLTAVTTASVTPAAIGAVSLTTADQTMSGGANFTATNQGTKSSGTFTVDCGACALQYLTNGGAFTLAAPANDGTCLILVTNNASAGAITFSGFTVSANTGDALTTTNTSKFIIQVTRINAVSTYQIKALQ